MDAQAFALVLAEIATHGNARKALRDTEHHFREFYGHIAASEEAREQYARAKSLGLDALADEILELADVCREGTKTKHSDKDGTTTETGDMVDRSRLAIDARKWLLAKLAPKKYGDSMDLKHSGAVAHELHIHDEPKAKC